MLRQTFARSARRPFSNFGTTRSRRGLAATSAVIVVSVLAYSSLNARVIQNDSLPPSGASKPAKLRNSSPDSPNSGDTLDTLVWGSNRCAMAALSPGPVLTMASIVLKGYYRIPPIQNRYVHQQLHHFSRTQRFATCLCTKIMLLA